MSYSPLGQSNTTERLTLTHLFLKGTLHTYTYRFTGHLQSI